MSLPEKSYLNAFTFLVLELSDGHLDTCSAVYKQVKNLPHSPVQLSGATAECSGGAECWRFLSVSVCEDFGYHRGGWQAGPSQGVHLDQGMDWLLQDPRAVETGRV